MFEKFTEKAIKVIMLAQEEARRLGHPFISTEEVLLGLIGESSGQAAIVLSQLGVTLRAAQREVEAVVRIEADGEVEVECGRDRKSTRLNSSHSQQSRMPSSS